MAIISNQNSDLGLSYQVLINIIQDLRVFAREAQDYKELKELKREIQLYQFILESIGETSSDLCNSI